MFYVDWSDFITQNLVASVFTAAGVDEERVSAEEARRLIRCILEAVGGFPVRETVPSDESKTQIVTRILTEAFRHTLSEFGVVYSKPGFVYSAMPGVALLENRVDAVSLVHVNVATASELDELEGIGPTIATRIIEQRATNGPFVSLDDLVNRIDGLGAGNAAKLRGVLNFALPSDISRLQSGSVDSLESAFQVLQQFVAVGGHGNRMLACLDIVATYCSSSRHPIGGKVLGVRDFGVTTEPEAVAAAWIGVLSGSDYYRVVPALLAEARQNIVVCMFHIALPEQTHPTRVLLDALVSAQSRGVGVRVLVDRDRATDPYRSTIINSAARRYLNDNGVACRFDTEARLLHSKYLVVDDRVVIGSHNWSAGSYFQYDDHSCVIESPAFAQVALGRFEESWTLVGGP